MSPNEVKVVSYPPEKYQWELEPLDKFAGLNADHPIAYEMGLTPQLVEEPDWCVILITPIKEVVNDTNGKVFNYRWMYGYKIQAQGRNLTPEFLFELMLHTWKLFKDHFEKTAKGTIVENKLMDKPIFSDAEKNLKMVLMMQGATRQ